MTSRCSKSIFQSIKQNDTNRSILQEELRFNEWQSENASYLSEELELWPINITTLLERTFGVRLGDSQSSEERIELSDYLCDLDALHQMLGGTSEDGEYWYVNGSSGKIWYEGHPDSGQVSGITMETSEYQLFGVYVTKDLYQARDLLEQDGWAQEDEYEDSFVCVKDSEWLQLSAVGGVVTSISYWNEAAME